MSGTFRVCFFSGYPVLAEEVTTLFSLDDCGICVNEVQSSVLPKRNDGPGPIRRLFNRAMVRWKGERRRDRAVSYTHLTLPTIYSV